MISLRRLRLRLTFWYIGSFATILVALATGLFFVLRRERAAELDRSLEGVVEEVFRAARIRLAEGRDVESALSLAVAEFDGAGRILYLFGPDGEAIPSDRAVPQEIARSARSGEVEGSSRAHFTTATGQRWRMSASRFDEPGVPSYMVVAVADAAALERHYGRLVEVFTAFGLLSLLPIAAGGVYLARIAAAPAVERLQQFTANAAHELRSPVAVLRGRAEIALERERQGSEYVEALRTMAEEAGRLGDIVEDLFLLSRADAGERRLAREKVFLDDLASDTIGSASVLARARGVRLALGRYEEAVVSGDPALLRRLLMTLLENGIKFTPEGGCVRLDVYVDAGSPTVTVEDEGIGISPEDLPHIFDRFFRSDAARNRSEGSGLGLSIARHITDLHRARIAVRSDVGGGTRFTITFPSTGL